MLLFFLWSERECGQLYIILSNIQLDLKRGSYLKDVKKSFKQGAKCSHQTLRSSECSEKVPLPPHVDCLSEDRPVPDANQRRPVSIAQCPTLGLGFGGSGSRDFCARFLVQMVSGADMGGAISFIRN